MAKGRNRSAEPIVEPATSPTPAPVPLPFVDTGRRWRVREIEGTDALEAFLNECEALGFGLDEVDRIDDGDVHRPPRFRVWACAWPVCDEEEDDSEAGGTGD